MFQKTIFTSAMALLALACSPASAQFTFTQVELSLDGNDGCSILRIDASGALTEWVSNSEILAISGETTCNPDDTGLAAAPDGTVFFSEDVSDQIYRVSPAGTVSLFVSKATLDAAVGVSNDIDNGMAFGADGNLYAADEDCDCIIQITPAGVVTVVLPKAAILAATGKTDADLEGGLSIAGDGTLYFVDEFNELVRGDDEAEDDSNRGGGETPNQERVLSASGGVVSIVATEADIVAATGNANTDLDVDIQLVGGTLYLLDDGSGGALIAVDVQSGAVSLVVNDSNITPITGSDTFDPEGGIAYDSSTGELIIGDDGNDPTTSDAQADILRVTPTGTVSLFVSNAALTAFYEGIYGTTNTEFRLRGGLDFQAPAPAMSPAVAVPTHSSASKALLALVLLLAGWSFIRRSL